VTEVETEVREIIYNILRDHMGTFLWHLHLVAPLNFF